MSTEKNNDWATSLDNLFGYGGAINQGFEAGMRLVDSITGNYHYPPPAFTPSSDVIRGLSGGFDPSSRRNMTNYDQYGGAGANVPRRRMPQYGYGQVDQYDPYQQRQVAIDECVGISNPQYGM